MLSRIRLLGKEMVHLIREHKLYFLAPIVLLLVFISVLFYKTGAALLVSFIYAGV